MTRDERDFGSTPGDGSGSTGGAGPNEDGTAGDGGTDRLGEVTLPVGDPECVVCEAFESVENAPLRADLPAPTVTVRYRPIVDVEAITRARFGADVGAGDSADAGAGTGVDASASAGDGDVHRIDRRDHVIVVADHSGLRLAPDDVVDLVGVEPVPLADARAAHGGEVVAFVGADVDYREWVTERLCETLAEEVTFPDANGEPFTTTCRPSPGDVSLRSLRTLYLPRISAVVELGASRHRYEYDAAGDRHAVREDSIRSCDHCATAGAGAASYTYCENCGSIACEPHVETERLTGDPVCTGCAVTEEFPLTTKYFFDEAARAAFRDQYAAMSLPGKLREHLPHLG